MVSTLGSSAGKFLWFPREQGTQTPLMVAVVTAASVGKVVMEPGMVRTAGNQKWQQALYC